MNPTELQMQIAFDGHGGHTVVSDLSESRIVNNTWMRTVKAFRRTTIRSIFLNSCLSVGEKDLETDPKGLFQNSFPQFCS